MDIDFLYKKTNQAFGWIALALLAVLICIFGNIEIKDLDLWLHLATGRYILQTGSIPNVDVLSHTIFGQAWNNHEWLFQIIIAHVYEMFGIEGWISLRSIILSLIFIHLFLIGFDKDKPLWPVVLLVLVFMNFQNRLLLRPEIFSLFFFVLYIYILNFHLDKRKIIFGITFIQMLWVNMHGFFIFGIFLIALMIFTEYLKRKAPLPPRWKSVGRLTDFEFKNIQYILIGAVAACFVNPNFIEGAIYPLKVLFSVGHESKIFFQEIQELQKPIVWDTLFSWHPYPFFRWMIIIPAVSFILNRRQLDVGALILWLFFLALALSAVRNIPFYTLIAYLVSLLNLQQINWQNLFSHQRSHIYRYMGSICVLILFCVWMLQMIDKAQYHGYYDFERRERKSEFGGVSLNNFAYKAVDFLEQNQIQGNMFNDFNSGAYLLGRWHPNIRVFIDGRTEVYGSEFFKKYKNAWRGSRRSLDDIMAKYAIDIAFLHSVYKAPSEELIQYFQERPEWNLVYFDHDAMIYLKDIPRHQAVIGAKKIDFKNWSQAMPQLWKEHNLKWRAYRYTNRAENFLHVGEYELAAEQLAFAHQIAPQNAEVYRLLGKLAYQQGQFEAAATQSRKALVLKPNLYQARFYYAKSLYALGFFDEAAYHLRKVEKKYPDHYKLLFSKALLELRETSLDEVWPLIAEAEKKAQGDFVRYMQHEPVSEELKHQIRERLKAGP